MSDSGNIYRKLGVEPVINCAGVRTQFGGSNPAPEVLAAMNEAAEAFVDLDELAEGVGRKLSALTGADWGIVTAGTTAALSLATAACIAGNNPELMLRLPRTEGMPHRVVMLEGQRFDYDHAILVTGAEIVCAKDLVHFESLLAGDAVMVCLLARRDSDSGMTLSTLAPIARQHAVPILVDAAGLSPSAPDRLLTEGAEFVVYSCGKYLRGPQSTALLLGRKNLCQAAWLNGAPHQAFGRTMKVGKEEMVGAVAALDRWLNAASAQEERASWLARLDVLAAPFADLRGISTTFIPSSAFVTAPRLRVQWDPKVVPIESHSLRAKLLTASPRILIHDFWSGRYSIVLDPVNLTDSEARWAAAAIRDCLLQSATATRAMSAGKPLLNLSGSWAARLSFLHREARHSLRLRQEGEAIVGEHIAQYSRGPVTGVVNGGAVSLVAKHQTDSLPYYYTFEGSSVGDELAGQLFLGAASDEHLGPVFQRQFGAGTWVAARQ